MPAIADELEMLRTTTRGWLMENAPVGRFRAARAEGSVVDRDALNGLCALGWGGAMVAERHGGSALGIAAAMVLAEECGRELVAVPVAQGLIGGALALGLSDDEGAGALLSRVGSGEHLVLLALNSADPGLLPTGTLEASGVRLGGGIAFVPDVELADRLLIPVRIDGAVRLACLETAAIPGRKRHLVDTRSYTTFALDGVTISRSALLPGAVTADACDHLLGCVYLSHAAEMLGGIERAFEITIDYLKVREQFGQRIGSFQALQHRAAQMLCKIAVLRATIEAAAAAADARAVDLPRLAAIAKAYACETSRLVMAEAIQMHGGIGMTDEHDIGLYFKRGRVSEALLGDAFLHRARYASLCGL